jgi:hypothetical protein
MTPTRSLVLFGSLVALAGGGCGVLDDLGDSHSGVTAAPPLTAPPPAAPADTTTTTPPSMEPPPEPTTTSPPPPEKGPPKCRSSIDCGAGLHCSTEDGDCQSLCPPNVGCVAVCAGTCVADKEPPPPPPGCATDADCYAAANYCGGGCSCHSMPVGTAPACGPQQGERVACFADPCLGLKPVCNADGLCAFAPTTPPPPAPPLPPLPSGCDRHTMGGPTSCKDASTWKRYSDEDCRSRGGSLTQYTQREMCPVVGNSVYVDYVCCSTI